MINEQLLNICGQAHGVLSPGECDWVFDLASRVRPGGCWVDIGDGGPRSFLAAGLGLPDESRLVCVPGIAGHNPASSGHADSFANCHRGVELLRQLRPRLEIDVQRADDGLPAGGVEDSRADVVFLPATQERARLAAQICDWREKLGPRGRLAGNGWGWLEYPGVTQAVSEALPGVMSGAGTLWTWTRPEPLEELEKLPRLSVVLATTGRETLPKTLASIRSQRLVAGDEVLLMHDGEAGARAVVAWDQSRLPGQMLILAKGPHHDWGAAARTAGQKRARGTHLLWQDDDDVYLPGVFDEIRREIMATPEAILLFRLVYPNGRLLWKHPVIECRNVSTQMYVIPRSARLGSWGSYYQGDFEFIRTTIAANPARPVRFVDKPTVMYSRAL